MFQVIEDLKAAAMFDNSIVLVTTDNGGEPWDSNSPLKGTKDTVYEGGIRGASFLMSPLLAKTSYKFNGLIHLVDWVPTLLQAAGAHFCDNSDSDQYFSDFYCQAFLNLGALMACQCGTV